MMAVQTHPDPNKVLGHLPKLSLMSPDITIGIRSDRFRFLVVFREMSVANRFCISLFLNHHVFVGLYIYIYIYVYKCGPVHAMHENVRLCVERNRLSWSCPVTPAYPR